MENKRQALDATAATVQLMAGTTNATTTTTTTNSSPADNCIFQANAAAAAAAVLAYRQLAQMQHLQHSTENVLDHMVEEEIVGGEQHRSGEKTEKGGKGSSGGDGGDSMGQLKKPRRRRTAFTQVGGGHLLKHGTLVNLLASSFSVVSAQLPGEALSRAEVPERGRPGTGGGDAVPLGDADQDLVPESKVGGYIHWL